MCLIGPTFKGKLYGDLGLPRPQRENKKNVEKRRRRRRREIEKENNKAHGLDTGQGSFIKS